jgi:hypothetical protein
LEKCGFNCPERMNRRGKPLASSMTAKWTPHFFVKTGRID